MTKLLYFSDHIKPIAKKIRFLLIVCGRFFIILFRWRKGIKLLCLDYAKKYQFDNSYLIIRYRFRNALWYNFKNIKKTTEKKIIVLNLKNVPVMPIELTAYGFFRSKTFHISVTPESILQNNSFKTAIKGINEIEIYSKPIILKEIKPTPTLPKIKLNHSEIQIKQPSYNQTDFL
jgi:hypothetical protein